MIPLTLRPYQIECLETIQAGYLCPITGYRVHTQTDLSKVHTRMGDFVQDELSEAVNNASRNARVVKSYLDRAAGKKAIVFAVNVQHAQSLSRLFQEVSVSCAAFTGEMDREVHRGILEDFREGSIRVLTNCMVLTEGFHQPDIEAVILARPTQSSLLYTQMIGRGTRMAPGKECLTVIDIVDNSRRHSLMSLATLFGLPADFDLPGRDLLEADREIEETCEKHPGLNLDRVTDLDALRLQVEKFDFFAEVALPEEVERCSRLTWFRMPDGSYRISIGKGEQAAICQNLLRQWEITVLGERLPASAPCRGELEIEDWKLEILNLHFSICNGAKRPGHPLSPQERPVEEGRPGHREAAGDAEEAWNRLPSQHQQGGGQLADRQVLRRKECPMRKEKAMGNQ